MDSTLVMKNHILVAKVLLVIETKHSTHTPRGRVGRYKPSRDPDRHTKDDNQ